MNSLYAPADSLKKVLHSVDMTKKVCVACNKLVSFNTWSRRWETNGWNGIYCKEAK